MPRVIVADNQLNQSVQKSMRTLWPHLFTIAKLTENIPNCNKKYHQNSVVQYLYGEVTDFGRGIAEDIEELPAINSSSTPKELLRYTAIAYVIEMRRIAAAVEPADPTRSKGGRNPPEVWKEKVKKSANTTAISDTNMVLSHGLYYDVEQRDQGEKPTNSWEIVIAFYKSIKEEKITKPHTYRNYNPNWFNFKLYENIWTS